MDLYIHVAVSCDVRTSREKNRRDCDPIEFVLLYLGISRNLHDNDEAKCLRMPSSVSQDILY